MRRNHTRQADLFAADPAVASPPVEIDEAFLARIRAELHSSLEMVRAAQRLPWRDFTQSALAEMRFESIANWLPAEEAAPLRTAYAAELDRLYEAG